jgi:hypothetical protein
VRWFNAGVRDGGVGEVPLLFLATALTCIRIEAGSWRWLVHHQHGGTLHVSI